MNKKIFLILVMLFLICTSTFAATAKVQINGNIIDFTDSNGAKVDPQIINNRTMVPLRKIFEMLNCTVDWNNDTRTVTATKNNTTLILQIDNKVARKIVNNKETKITLDTAPIIYNNRTLVPLRFIAESLEKQVGWDSANYTAIIIDYEYFAETLKTKAKMLYEILEENYDNADIEIKREYIDLLNASNNNIANIKTTVTKNNDIYETKINFSGNNSLIKDIIEEGWNNIDLKMKFDENSVNYTTTNTTLAKMLAITPNEQNNVKNTSLNLNGNVKNNFSGYVRDIINLKDSELNINSFKKVNTEWNKILNSLTYTNLGESISFKISNIHSLELKYFDITKFDNIIYGNVLNKIYNIINKKIFNYDLNLEELMYDTNSIVVNGTISNGYKNSIITITTTNEYDEKIIYTIKLNIK